jgi:hypothetical protein
MTAANLTVEAEDLEIENGLTFDKVLLRGSGVSYDPVSRRLSVPSAGELEAFVSAQRIADFAAASPPEKVTELDVHLGEGEVRVTARVQALVSVRVEATGRLETVDGAKIEFRATQVKVAGIGAPGGLVDAVLAEVNPLLDLSGLAIPVRITGVIVTPEGIRLTAAVGPI